MTRQLWRWLQVLSTSPSQHRWTEPRHAKGVLEYNDGALRISRQGTYTVSCMYTISLTSRQIAKSQREAQKYVVASCRRQARHVCAVSQKCHKCTRSSLKQSDWCDGLSDIIKEMVNTWAMRITQHGKISCHIGIAIIIRLLQLKHVSTLRHMHFTAYLLWCLHHPYVILWIDLAMRLSEPDLFATTSGEPTLWPFQLCTNQQIFCSNCKHNALAMNLSAALETSAIASTFFSKVLFEFVYGLSSPSLFSFVLFSLIHIHNVRTQYEFIVPGNAYWANNIFNCEFGPGPGPNEQNCHWLWWAGWAAVQLSERSGQSFEWQPRKAFGSKSSSSRKYILQQRFFVIEKQSA